MTTICQGCRTAVAHEHRFCPNCGLAMEHRTRAAPRPPAPVFPESADSGNAGFWGAIGAFIVLVFAIAAISGGADTPVTPRNSLLPDASSAERATDSIAYAAISGRMATASRADLVRFDHLAHRWGFGAGHDSAAHAKATGARLDSAEALLRGDAPSPSAADAMLSSVWSPLSGQQEQRKTKIGERVQAAYRGESRRAAAREVAGRVDAIIADAPCKPSRAKVRRSLERHPDWDASVLSAVVCGRVQIGMTREQAIAGWGRPRDINRTTALYGVHEQWVYGEYGSGYLYFEDGRLTTVQN
jgi:hypothetical protein